MQCALSVGIAGHVQPFSAACTARPGRRATPCVHLGCPRRRVVRTECRPSQCRTRRACDRHCPRWTNGRNKYTLLPKRARCVGVRGAKECAGYGVKTTKEGWGKQGGLRWEVHVPSKCTTTALRTWTGRAKFDSCSCSQLGGARVSPAGGAQLACTWTLWRRASWGLNARHDCRQRKKGGMGRDPRPLTRTVVAGGVGNSHIDVIHPCHAPGDEDLSRGERQGGGQATGARPSTADLTRTRGGFASTAACDVAAPPTIPR